MAEQFYTILTKLGKAKIANSAALGSKVDFVKLKIGDGGGKYYNPTENQDELINQVWEGNIGSVKIDKENSNWVIVETVIPSDVGGFFIREAGIYDDEDNLIAISKLAETYKPLASEGSSKDLIIRVILEVSNAENVTLKIDPTVILATKKDVQVLESNINKKIDDINSSLKEIANKVDNIKITDATITQKGIVQLNNTTNSTSITQAATANAVKLAMDRANEAFTGADNYKKGIAGVIGNPVLDTQNKDEAVNSIQGIKNNAASELKAKKVDANGNEALASLVNKIANITIEGMGGIKFTISNGVLSNTRTKFPTLNVNLQETGTFFDKKYIEVNVGFKPKYVIAYANYKDHIHVATLYDSKFCMGGESLEIGYPLVKPVYIGNNVYIPFSNFDMSGTRIDYIAIG